MDIAQSILWAIEDAFREKKNETDIQSNFTSFLSQSEFFQFDYITSNCYWENPFRYRVACHPKWFLFSIPKPNNWYLVIKLPYHADSILLMDELMEHEEKIHRWVKRIELEIEIKNGE